MRETLKCGEIKMRLASRVYVDIAHETGFEAFCLLPKLLRRMPPKCLHKCTTETRSEVPRFGIPSPLSPSASMITESTQVKHRRVASAPKTSAYNR